MPVYAGLTPQQTRAAQKRSEEPSYTGTFTGAKKYVLQTFSNSPSALMKKRVSRYLVGGRCSECGGKRLKREALTVKFMGLDIAELSALPFSRLAKVLEPAARGELLGPRHGQTLAAEVGERDRQRRHDAGHSSHDGAEDVRRTPNMSEEKRIVAQRIAHDVLERVSTLVGLGLGYLSLDRSTPTLSEGPPDEVARNRESRTARYLRLALPS